MFIVYPLPKFNPKLLRIKSAKTQAFMQVNARELWQFSTVISNRWSFLSLKFSPARQLVGVFFKRSFSPRARQLPWSFGSSKNGHKRRHVFTHCGSYYQRTRRQFSSPTFNTGGRSYKLHHTYLPSTREVSTFIASKPFITKVNVNNVSIAQHGTSWWPACLV